MKKRRGTALGYQKSECRTIGKKEGRKKNLKKIKQKTKDKRNQRVRTKENKVSLRHPAQKRWKTRCGGQAGFQKMAKKAFLT